MTKETQERTLPVHPLEAKGAAKWLILPMMGVEVIVRKVDFGAVVQGGMRYALQTGALSLAALEFAKEATELTQEDSPRERGQLDALEALQMQRIAQVAVFRNALITPKLDDLLSRYGGDEEFDDFGFGPDFSVLNDALTELNPSMSLKGGEPAMKRARAFPVDARGGTGKPGRKVREKTK